MATLRDCSTSYTFPQVRALLAAALQRELGGAVLRARVELLGAELPEAVQGDRRLAWKGAYALLPAGNESRAPRRAARLRQRELPGMPEVKHTPVVETAVYHAIERHAALVNDAARLCGALQALCAEARRQALGFPGGRSLWLTRCELAYQRAVRRHTRRVLAEGLAAWKGR